MAIAQYRSWQLPEERLTLITVIFWALQAGVCWLSSHICDCSAGAAGQSKGLPTTTFASGEQHAVDLCPAKGTSDDTCGVPPFNHCSSPCSSTVGGRAGGVADPAVPFVCSHMCR
jgi:hypothetical protein